MNKKKTHCLRMKIGIICSLAILSTTVSVTATNTDNLEQKSSSLKQELDNINDEIVKMSTEIANVEIQIENTNNNIISTEEQLSIIKNTETEQYEEMKKRIQYMYENGDIGMLELLFSAENIGDFVNKADFIRNVSSYDQKQLESLKYTVTTYKEQQNELSKKKKDLESLESDLQAKKEALNQKAAKTSTNIANISKQIEKIKEDEQKRLAEQAAKEEAETSTNSQPSSQPSYSYPTSGGALTPSKGVVYFNGHRETYYSQRVLPGTGLNIPGRHVAADGTIRDVDNYICVASSDLAKGTLVETSLGMGKVYDSGCASGTIDIYTDW